MLNRRQSIQLGAGLLAFPVRGLTASEEAAESPAAGNVIRRPIPSSGETIPVMGMGTSRTFDTGGDPASLAPLHSVMQAFIAGGGAIIDSSPMYGRAESRVGDVLRDLDPRPPIFAATKVWVTGRDKGIAQMEESERRMGVKPFDLIAVHNLLDWQTHLATLKEWKQAGRVRYIGITTSHGRDHDQFLEIMRSQPLDFAQFSYSIDNRKAEKRLLPLAQERGIATMINRPFQRGALFGKTRGVALPGLAAELGCDSWAQFFLKFILAHPAVTCIIPATASAEHMADNMRANIGPIPDERQRTEMLRLFEAL